jgi:hypothetical protein
MNYHYCSDCDKTILGKNLPRHLKSKTHLKKVEKKQRGGPLQRQHRPRPQQGVVLHRGVPLGHYPQQRQQQPLQDQIRQQRLQQLQPKLEQKYVITEEDRKEQATTCQICFMEYEENTDIKFDCGHKYCNYCVEQYLNTAINDNKKEICCIHPKCKEFISFDIIEKTIKPDMLEKYNKNLIDKITLQDDCFYCPNNKCSKILFIDNNTDTKSYCPHCGEKISSCCKKLGWHEGQCKVLEENADKDLEKFLKISNNIKKCPTCCTLIEKTDGCEHIYCFNCKTHFNWITMAKYKKQNMYIPFQPTNYFNRLAMKHNDRQIQQDYGGFF